MTNSPAILRDYDRELTVKQRAKIADDIERYENAAEKALDWMESADHLFNCPRGRDDYDCTCGRDEAIQALYGVFEGAQ